MLDGMAHFSRRIRLARRWQVTRVTRIRRCLEAIGRFRQHVELGNCHLARQETEAAVGCCNQSVCIDVLESGIQTGTDFFMGVQYENNEAESLDEIRNLPLSIDGPDGRVTVPLSNVATVRRRSRSGGWTSRTR